jgi:HAD superfamily hydrolase (TIGR01662 family)
MGLLFCLYMAVKLIIFDLWNTLIFRDMDVDITKSLPDIFNLTEDKKKLNKKFEHAVQKRKDWPSRRDAYRNVCVAWGVEPTDENADTIATIRDKGEQTVKLFPHVESMLQQLKEQGFKIGLISNSSVFAVENVRKTLGDSLFKKIDYPVFSFDVGAIKPNPHMFWKMLFDAECRASECIMIGDKLEDDVIPAEKAGMDGIYFDPKHGGYEQLKKDFAGLGVSLR